MSTVAQLIARKRYLAAGGKRRPSRPADVPLAQPPSAVVLEYGTLLAEVFAEVNAAIRRGLEGADILTRQDSPNSPMLDMAILASQSVAAVAKMKKEVNLVLNVYNFGFRLQQIGHRTAHWSGMQFKRQLRSALGIDLLGDPDVGPVVRKFRNENVELIREVSMEKINRVKAVIQAAPLEGRHENLVGKIQEATGYGDARCRLIARDQVLRLYGTVNEARHTAAGITHYTWVTSRDERVRPDHADLDKQTFAYRDPPITDKATGRRRHPGQDFQCRCIANPVISID